MSKRPSLPREKSAVIKNHVSDTAASIAVLLDRDPVMAAQLKEHLSEERLFQLLELPEQLEVVAYRDICDVVRETCKELDEALIAANL